MITISKTHDDENVDEKMMKLMDGDDKEKVRM